MKRFKIDAMIKLCDEYCRYPKEYAERYADDEEAQERLAIERCEDCPIVEAFTMDAVEEDDRK